MEKRQKKNRLTVSRAEAAQKIKEQIDKGQKIIQQVMMTGMPNFKLFEWAETEGNKWSEYNLQLLNQLFEDDSIAVEYNNLEESWNMAGIAQYTSFVQEKRSSPVDPCIKLNNLLEKLKSILSRLDVIEEPTIPKKKRGKNRLFFHPVIIAALITAAVTILTTIISKNSGHNIKETHIVDMNNNQNLGQQPIFSNKGDVNATFVQNQGLDPNKLVDKFGDTQKVLGKTEYELEKIKRENQELQNIVNAYKLEDKEKRAVLERAENIEKTKIIVKIFQEQDKGNISKEVSSKLSDMVNRALWEDLKSFLENKNVKIDEHNQSLVFSGICKVEVKDDGASRLVAMPIGHPKIVYVLTPEGNKLYEIAKDVNF